mgnify:FL=1
MLPRSVATTATCICGTVTKHTPDLRTYTCPTCGHTEDRDIHAAKNMIRLGSATNPTRLGLTGTPVETDIRPAADMDFTFMPATGNQSTKQEAATSLGSP